MHRLFFAFAVRINKSSFFTFRFICYVAVFMLRFFCYIAALILRFLCVSFFLMHFCASTVELQ